jgi:lysophospholipid acyltransferase (LPLAT)-like uncharacterized protein
MAFRLRPVEHAGLGSLSGLAISSFVTRWMETLDYQGLFFDEEVDPASPGFQGPAIYVFWHEYIPFLFYLRGHCRISMLLSKHQDAEWLSQAARHMGFSIVRGSSKRGGDAALRELMRRGKSENLAITPDGPRGPRRRLASGAIYVSSALQIPIVAVGLGYASPSRLPTWDRFAVPRPGSRARAVLGPALQIPTDLDREGIESYRQLVEGWLAWTTDEAEAWAESGRSYSNQVAAYRKPAAPRVSAASALRLEYPHDEMPADPMEAAPSRASALSTAVSVARLVA